MLTNTNQTSPLVDLHSPKAFSSYVFHERPQQNKSMHRVLMWKWIYTFADLGELINSDAFISWLEPDIWTGMKSRILQAVQDVKIHIEDTRLEIEKIVFESPWDGSYHARIQRAMKKAWIVTRQQAIDALNNEWICGISQNWTPRVLNQLKE